jgi:hypothetical protein
LDAGDGAPSPENDIVAVRGCITRMIVHAGILGPRREMSALLDHCPHSVAAAAEETVREGQVFDILRLNVNRHGPMIRLNSPNNEYD